MELKTIIMCLIGIFILFRIYRRARQNIGWQPLSPTKMKLRSAIFFILGLLFLVAEGLHPINLISEVLAIALGSVLAYYGAALTKLEQRDGKWQYLTNMWIGGSVTLLFLGRFSYRMYVLFTQGVPTGHGAADKLSFMGYSANSSWTSGLSLIMFAYYVVYYLLLLKKRKMASSVTGERLRQTV
ncbi:hypothetical protein [Paenibacillus thalictri]|uniref:DUF1453 family protein n=1 Tax=Paenibacillus thalictri TaxID=2527873 RepID=A0A4Q9DPQ1_9BACL|nr:hypothetical protein [Paenibacillus thalictri]TBL75770.1 hypothetical protein EYB31_22575 [Paenibacillus thalictri]